MQGSSLFQNGITAGNQDSFLYSCFEDFYCEILRSKQKVLARAWLQPDSSGLQTTPEAFANDLINHFISYFELQEKSLFGSNLVGTVQTLYEEIKFAMVVFTDEIFLNLDWPAHQYWEDNLLEQRIYGTHSGGQAFFDRINSLLLHQSSIWADVARVYLAILGLGFRGKYLKSNNDEELQVYSEKLYSFTNNTPVLSVQAPLLTITPQAAQETVSGLRSKELPDTRNWYFAFTLIGISYLLISYAIWSYSTSSISNLVDRVISNTNYANQIGGAS
jgi:type VI secretion system protein ImpK